jgi:hypothetical protein
MLMRYTFYVMVSFLLAFYIWIIQTKIKFTQQFLSRLIAERWDTGMNSHDLFIMC